MSQMELDDNTKKTNQVDDSSNQSAQLLNASSADVLEKYKTAGVISNRTLHHLLSSARPGMPIVDLCRMGDEMITNEINKVYETLKAPKHKGICFPTCVSVNEVAGHNSPFSNDKRSLHLGDMVKIDLGTHIDGFCAVVAHTIVLGECNGRKADAIAAAWSAAQSAIRLLRPKNKNAQVTLAIEKSAKTFKTEPMDSVLSHEMRQYVIDHENTIISKETPERKVAEIEFEDHQVFGIDIMISSGRGKAVDRGEKCTIYKRNVEVERPLKMKISRELYKMVNKQHPTFPFTMRSYEENRSRLGITELLRSNIVQPYPILSEKHGEYVAQFKFTVIVNPKTTIQITGLPLNMADVHPSQQIQDGELNKLLSTKFDGVLPEFYEEIEPRQYDESLGSGKEKKSGGQQQKKGNKGKSGGKGKSQGQKGNKQRNQKNKQGGNKKKNQQQKRKKGGNAQKQQKNRSNNQKRSTQAMDLD